MGTVTTDHASGTPPMPRIKGAPRSERLRAQRIARAKANHAVQLSNMGYTFESIAQTCWHCVATRQVGNPGEHREYQAMYSHRSSAKKAVDRALEEEYGRTAETREAVRRRGLARSEMLIRHAMVDAIGGDPQARRDIIKLLEYQARVYGTNAPTKVALTTETDQAIYELLEEITSMAAAPDGDAEVMPAPGGDPIAVTDGDDGE